jgi:glycine betaine/proline transport system ATP-binding protein
MQQRVGLARALSVDPEILLCDEPFSALDPLIRREMQDELIRLQKVVHKTVLFITHDFLEALKIGDRIAIMKNGEIVQIGTPEQIVAHPANDYVREFTKDVPRIKVLTASIVMQPLNTHEHEDYASVPADMRLETLIQVIANDDRPRYVIQDGEKVGFVDQHCIMQVLAREGE